MPAPRLVLDVMGGDHAPDANLDGAALALADLARSGTELYLVGEEAKLGAAVRGKRRRRALADALEQGQGVRLVAATENIDMEDSIRAIRRKPGASINVGIGLAARSYADGRKGAPGAVPTAFISAGHSGAVMASAFLHMGRLAGAERPAIAVKLPTLSQDGCVLLDVGANVDCKPEHLRDFAVMGGIYGQVERKGAGLPRVGLLSNGEERGKGNELTRAALEMIELLPCFQEGPQQIGRFVGYTEGKEIFKGEVDVVVTDGFVGNVVLKSLEGLGSAVVTTLKREIKRNWFAAFGLPFMAPAFHGLKRKLDYAEYGAAPLLGVAGYAFICHGRSNPKAVKNALLRARSALESGFVEKLEGALSLAVGASAPKPHHAP